MSNIKQESFFDAIEKQNILLVREMLEKGVNVNALSSNGTALYLSVKLHNFELIKLLVENDADINFVQLDFNDSERHPKDGLLHSCFISTTIDFLCVSYQNKNDEILKYLLEKRPMVSETMIEERIQYCRKLFNEKQTNEKMLFNYCASYFLRKNMYDHILPIGDDAVATMVAATFNFDAKLPNRSLNDGGTHQAFFTLMVRSLFEQLVRFKLKKGSNIESNEYTHVLRELRHSLEAYNLLMDISRIPHERIVQFYPSIVNNIINKLKFMKYKEEYTLPVRWERHAVCLNFVRETDSIIIRIDNLNVGERRKHETYQNTNNCLVIIPKIIGEIPLEKLDDNRDYFTSIIECIKVRLGREDGIKLLYQNTRLEHLNISRELMLTNQLKKQSETLDCFIQQVESNCFIKSHEPGIAIRSNDRHMWQQITNFQKVQAGQLATEDLTHKRNELENVFDEYWRKETIVIRANINLDDFVPVENKDLQLHEEIGRGGFGTVYRATWLSKDDVVAVKKLHPTHLDKEAEQTFFNELSLLNRVCYSHIVTLYGACLEKGMYALVMEYMSLGSLHKILHEKTVEISWPERMSIALQAAKGINYLHQYQPQILHRDIKPLNFLLGKTLEGYLVKVCDFGVAKTRSETTRQTTDKTLVAFTLAWTAPEILRLRPHTNKSDVYSLGIVYWELATNQKPYDGYHHDTIRAFVIAADRLEIPDTTPSDFRTIIEKCWAHNPDDRPDGSRLIKMIKECIEKQSNSHIIAFSSNLTN